MTIKHMIAASSAALLLAACGGADEAEDDAMSTPANAPMANADRTVATDFGTDSSEFANDGKCDDPRFEGEGMTDTELLNADIRADATDCRTAFEAGTITLRTDI